MNVDGAPKVIEYNVRMGDPETEVVFPRINNSLLEMMSKARDKRLNSVKFNLNPQYCTTVFMVSGGYPEAYDKGKAIEFGETPDSILFHAGTKISEHRIVTNGGRVIAVSSFGDSMRDALNKSYRSIEQINFEKATWRNDIGLDLEAYLGSTK